MTYAVKVCTRKMEIPIDNDVVNIKNLQILTVGTNKWV